MADKGAPKPVSIREFLEKAPLYLRTVVQLPEACTENDLPIPLSLELSCEHCKTFRTFVLAVKDNKKAPEGTTAPFRLLAIADHVIALNASTIIHYRCADCGGGTCGFWLKWEPIDPTKERRGSTLGGPNGITAGHVVNLAPTWAMRKIGQTKAPLPHSSNALRTMLADDYELYRRALQCMSMGFGIGAVAYLRRVIEHKTLALLDRLKALLEAENDTEALEKLAKAHGSHSSQERLELASELLPKSLRPGGHNPLLIMFGALSAEIHASDSEANAQASEATAHETAARLQHALEFLVTRIDQELGDLARFGATIAKETNRA